MSRDDDTGQQPTIAPWQRELVVDARSGKRRDTRGKESTADAGRTSREAQAVLQTHVAGDDWDAVGGDRLASPPPARRRREPHSVFGGAPWAGIVALVCALFAAASQIIPSSIDFSTPALVAAIVALVLGGYALAGGFMGRGRTDIAAGAVVLAVVSILVGIWFDRPAPLLTPT